MKFTSSPFPESNLYTILFVFHFTLNKSSAIVYRFWLSSLPLYTCVRLSLTVFYVIFIIWLKLTMPCPALALFLAFVFSVIWIACGFSPYILNTCSNSLAFPTSPHTHTHQRRYFKYFRIDGVCLKSKISQYFCAIPSFFYCFYYLFRCAYFPLPLCTFLGILFAWGVIWHSL